MRNGLLVAALAAMLVVLPAGAAAQFGHPLKGQWSGEWGPKEKPNRLLLNLQWDGKEVTGEVNPGSNGAGSITKVTIDYSNIKAWKVQMEGTVKDPSGKEVPLRIDGVLENLGAYRRLLHGTWMQGSQNGPFLVTRN